MMKIQEMFQNLSVRFMDQPTNKARVETVASPSSSLKRARKGGDDSVDEEYYADAISSGDGL